MEGKRPTEREWLQKKKKNFKKGAEDSEQGLPLGSGLFTNPSPEARFLPDFNALESHAMMKEAQALVTVGTPCVAQRRLPAGPHEWGLSGSLTSAGSRGWLETRPAGFQGSR